MSTKLTSDLSQLLRVMFFLICFIFPISTRNVEETFAPFFVFLRFEIGLDSKIAFVFFQMFSMQYFILDPKTLRFPCCRSSFGH